MAGTLTTALQTYALPGRRGGPYTRPTPPFLLPKLFIETATRKAPYRLKAARVLLFILEADGKRTFTLEV